MEVIVLCIPADRLMHGFAGRGGLGGGKVGGRVRGVQISPVPFNPCVLRGSHESSVLRSRPVQMGRGHNEAAAASSHPSAQTEFVSPVEVTTATNTVVMVS